MTLSAADRLAILDVITRADEEASRRDPDAYVALFTEDAVLDGTQGRDVGRKALRSGVGPIWAAEGPVTLHLTLNPVVEPGRSRPARRLHRPVRRGRAGEAQAPSRWTVFAAQGGKRSSGEPARHLLSGRSGSSEEGHGLSAAARRWRGRAQ